MTLEEMKIKTAELIGLATTDSQARTSELLTEITDGFTHLFNENETNKQQVSDLTAKNETLRDVNSKLFLKVGEVPKTTEATASETSVTSETSEIPNISIDSLFNANGELI